MIARSSHKSLNEGETLLAKARPLIISVRSHSTQVESSRFLTTDLKSISTDWLETTWNDFNLAKRRCLFDNILREIGNIIQVHAIFTSNVPIFVISTLISRNLCNVKIIYVLSFPVFYCGLFTHSVEKQVLISFSWIQLFLVTSLVKTLLSRNFCQKWEKISCFFTQCVIVILFISTKNFVKSTLLHEIFHTFFFSTVMHTKIMHCTVLKRLPIKLRVDFTEYLFKLSKDTNLIHCTV